jgi:hypothetical protein
MCTTSAECKIVIIAVLTVKSSMDPHMISPDSGWFGNGSIVRTSNGSWNMLVEWSSWSWMFSVAMSSWSWMFP